MQNRPEKHHYIPKFYLAGFTRSGEVDGELYVLDKSQRRQWASSPKKAAFQHHFHTIEALDGGDPMAIERELSKIEGTCSVAIRRIIASRDFPTGADLDVLLNFVALMAVRVPLIREKISNFIDDVIKDLYRTMLGSEAGWDRFKQAYESSGGGVNFSREEMKSFVDSDKYTADFDRTWHVGMMLSMGAKLVPALAKRNWAIWLADDGAPDLICSDRPVCLTWHTAEPPPLPPGFANPNTAVIMPINRQIAIVGTFEQLPTESILDEHAVATINRSTCEYANQIFSAEPDFGWAMTDTRIGNANDLMTMITQHAQP